MDLVREILLAPGGCQGGVSARAIHDKGLLRQLGRIPLLLMNEAGLINAVETGELGAGPSAIPLHLTWAGYEFLEVAREPTRWKKARRVLLAVGGASVDVWQEVNL